MKTFFFLFFFFGGGGGVRPGGGGGEGRGGGSQGGCEQRIEVFVKNSKKKNFLGGGCRWGVGVGGVGSGWGVRVDVNEELKFL